MDLTQSHLLFLLTIAEGNSYKKPADLSATKQLLAMKLLEYKLLDFNENGYIRVTERGQRVISLAVSEGQRYLVYGG